LRLLHVQRCHPQELEVDIECEQDNFLYQGNINEITSHYVLQSIPCNQAYAFIKLLPDLYEGRSEVASISEEDSKPSEAE